MALAVSGPRAQSTLSTASSASVTVRGFFVAIHSLRARISTPLINISTVLMNVKAGCSQRFLTDLHNPPTNVGLCGCQSQIERADQTGDAPTCLPKPGAVE